MTQHPGSDAVSLAAGVSAGHWEAHLLPGAGDGDGTAPGRALRLPHWNLQPHLGREAAGLGEKQSPLQTCKSHMWRPWQGLCGPQSQVAVGVSPLANGTSPSSTTSVGIAPLP